MYKAAVIGLGIGEQHIHALQSHPKCQLVSLCDLDEKKAEDLAGQYTVADYTTTYDALIENPDINLLVIASYDDHHASQVLKAIQANKHVFVEKPLCRTPAELQSIYKAWQAQPVGLMSNLVLRAAPLFQWLKQAIAAGELGDIYAIDGEYLYGRLKKITHGWRKDVDDYSIIDGGAIHMIDLMMYLTDQKPQQVQTVGNKIVSQGTDYRYDDYAAMTFTFASGLIGRITANFGCVHPHQHILKVYGSKATFILDDMGARLQTARDMKQMDDYQGPYDRPAAQPLDQASTPQGKGALIADFIEILEKQAFLPQIQHEMALISACTAANKALLSRRSEDIEYLS